MTYHAHTAPNGEYVASDDDLPGMWSHADFEGGDPDTRSYAERGWAPGVTFDAVADIRAFQETVNQSIRDLVALMEPEADPPLCRQEIPTEGTE